VQYGDEITAELRKTLPKRKLIAEWIEPALFASAQLTVRFVGEEEGRTLNAGYRHKDYPTNVLTSPTIGAGRHRDRAIWCCAARSSKRKRASRTSRSTITRTC
jgi:ssRNA-specific RNase YbeY (16S rRNA maturation enzyme)